jgi:vesicle transport protein SEC22
VLAESGRWDDALLLLSHLSFLIIFHYQNITLQWRMEIDKTDRPYRFINYDPLIQRKQKEFQDERQQRSKLNDDLSEIQSIMKKNITDILDRGEKLDNVQNISAELMSKSSNFKWGTRKLTLQARLQQYLPLIIVGLIVVFIIYVKFFW